MASSTHVSPFLENDRVLPPQQMEKLVLWQRCALGVVVLLAVWMDFFNLGTGRDGNLYYAATVRSMADSFHTFFFASYDPGGFVTVDKPPLGFWLQVLSTKIFGFTAFSLFFPQALCGVLAVLLLFFLVHRHFGFVIGLVAALALAVSPVSVVTNRNNTIDGTLILVLLLAAWAVISATETGKLRWLLLSAALVGLGFNIKMSQALLVVPALGLTYLLCAPRSLWTRVWHLALAGLVLVVISLSWVVAVDLTPVLQRPWIGSTPDNSALSLALGYNGVNRLHLIINPQVQVWWLLPFALLGTLALIRQRRFHFQKDIQQLGLILWGSWFLTMLIFFTLDGSVAYYTAEMVPGLSAMVGIGLVVMWQDYRRRAGWRGWLLPVTLLVTAVLQIFLLVHYPIWSSWMSPLIGIVTALVVIGLVLFRLRPRLDDVRGSMLSLASVLVSIGVLALLIGPTVWAGYSVVTGNAVAAYPYPGPPIGRQIIDQEPDKATPALVSYLESHQGSTKFLVATETATTADAFILTTNRPVMAMGGFLGGSRNPILTTSHLQALIKNGTIRFFWLSSSSWVTDHCRVVPARDWQTPGTTLPSNQRSNTLYDCSSMH